MMAAAKKGARTSNDYLDYVNNMPISKTMMAARQGDLFDLGGFFGGRDLVGYFAPTSFLDINSR